MRSCARLHYCSSRSRSAPSGGVLIAALANSPVPILERADGFYRLTPNAIDLRRRREALAFGHAFGMIKERAYLLSN